MAKSDLLHSLFSIIKINKRKEVLVMSCRIIYTGGHVEVFDLQGNFMFSADTESEAIRELGEWAA